MLTVQSRPVAEALYRFAISKHITYQYLQEQVTLDELLQFLPVYEAYVPGVREHLRAKRVKNGLEATEEQVENDILRAMLVLLVDIFRERDKQGLS